MAPAGMRSYWRGEYLRELGDEAIDAFLAHGVELTTLGAPLSQMVIFRVGQGVSAVSDDATAFSHRDAAYLFHPISMWSDPVDDARMITASRAYADLMRPYGTGGAYLNFTPEADRVRDAYGEATYARLVGLKDVYDPGNLFRLNQNVRPTQPAAEPVMA
jgi:FAD/FMN-containing dehydrogenase